MDKNMKTNGEYEHAKNNKIFKIIYKNINAAHLKRKFFN